VSEIVEEADYRSDTAYLRRRGDFGRRFRAYPHLRGPPSESRKHVVQRGVSDGVMTLAHPRYINRFRSASKLQGEGGYYLSSLVSPSSRRR